MRQKKYIYTVELQLSGLIGTAKHQVVQNIQIIGFFFDVWLNGLFEVGEKILQTALLSQLFIYVQIKY